MLALIILPIIYFIITVSIIKDTKVKVYHCYNSNPYNKYYINTIPIWGYMLILFASALPFINNILFLAFIIYYLIHCYWDPSDRCYETHVFSLRGNNIITKIIIDIKNSVYNILTKEF